MEEDRSLDTRLDDLEILAAHQAQMLEDLNDVIVEQAKVIADMRRKVEVLTGRMEEVEASAGEASPNQKPPHW